MDRYLALRLFSVARTKLFIEVFKCFMRRNPEDSNRIIERDIVSNLLNLIILHVLYKVVILYLINYKT